MIRRELRGHQKVLTGLKIDQCCTIVFKVLDILLKTFSYKDFLHFKRWSRRVFTIYPTFQGIIFKTPHPKVLTNVFLKMLISWKRHCLLGRPNPHAPRCFCVFKTFSHVVFTVSYLGVRKTEVTGDFWAMLYVVLNLENNYFFNSCKLLFCAIHRLLKVKIVLWSKSSNTLLEVVPLKVTLKKEI